MKNYRQYYGSNKIEFAERAQGFTVIYGKNGEGKSNLLNAINWCLYGIEPHGMKSNQSDNLRLPIVNTRHIREVQEKQKAEVKVEVWIKKGDTIYSITRILGILKDHLETQIMPNGEELVLTYTDKDTGENLPKGCERLGEPHSKIVVQKKGVKDLDFNYLDPKKDGTDVQVINNLLPGQLAKFYLLDGEFLESFWDNNENIKMGIEQISQLHYLSYAEKCIEQGQPKGGGIATEIEKYNNDILTEDNFLNSIDDKQKPLISQEPKIKISESEETRYYHLSGYPRLEELKEDKKRVDKRNKELKDELLIVGGQVNDLLKKQLIEHSENLEKQTTNLSAESKTFRSNLINLGPMVMLKSEIQDTVDKIQEKIDLGDLPRKARRILTELVLQKHKCICGEPLEDGDEKTEELKEFLEKLQDTEDLDDLQQMAFYLKSIFLDKFEEISKTKFQVPSKNIDDLEEVVRTLTQKVSDTEKQLGISSKGRGPKIAKEMELMDYYSEKLQGMIERTNTDIRRSEDRRASSKTGREKAIKANYRKSKVAFQLNIWQRTSKIFEEIKNSIKEDIRNNVEKTLWSNWISLLSNPSEFKSIQIAEDYSVTILDKEKEGFNKVRALSAGQSLLLTLAFVAAIREPTGFKFPLVIDSPAGKIDGPNTHNIGTRLPEFLPNAQITLLVTNKEYTDYISPDDDFKNLPKTPVCELFKEKIDVQHFKIQKEKDPHNPNVGNSQILPGKLTFVDESNKNREGWMVVADE